MQGHQLYHNFEMNRARNRLSSYGGSNEVAYAEGRRHSSLTFSGPPLFAHEGKLTLRATTKRDGGIDVTHYALTYKSLRHTVGVNLRVPESSLTLAQAFELMVNDVSFQKRLRHVPRNPERQSLNYLFKIFLMALAPSFGEVNPGLYINSKWVKDRPVMVTAEGLVESVCGLIFEYSLLRGRGYASFIPQPEAYFEQGLPVLVEIPGSLFGKLVNADTGVQNFADFAWAAASAPLNQSFAPGTFIGRNFVAFPDTYLTIVDDFKPFAVTYLADNHTGVIRDVYQVVKGDGND